MDKIDLSASKQALLDTGRTIAGWSRVNNLNPETVKAFFRGKFTTLHPKEGVYGQIVKTLRKDKFLKFKDHQDRLAA